MCDHHLDTFSLTEILFFCLHLTVLERRYPKEIQDIYEAMRRFARILGPIEHDKFIESHACRHLPLLMVSGGIDPFVRNSEARPEVCRFLFSMGIEVQGPSVELCQVAVPFKNIPPASSS